MAVKKKALPKKDKAKKEPVNPNKSQVMVHVGAGKGKTTAAMGTAIRAMGAGMNVYILQFVKAKKLSEEDKRGEGEWPLSAEIDFFNKLPAEIPGLGKVQTEQVGIGFVGILGDQKARVEHIKAAIEGLNRAKEIIRSGKWQLMVFDELISALELNLITEQDVLDLCDLLPAEGYTLILTGHNNYTEINERADLITEMKMIKHPYYKGLLARRGIDY